MDKRAVEITKNSSHKTRATLDFRLTLSLESAGLEWGNPNPTERTESQSRLTMALNKSVKTRRLATA